MILSNFVIRDTIIPRLSETTRDGVLREMVRSLQKANFFQESEVDLIVEEVLKRERLGSTGIGRNIAIPHTRYSGIDRLIGTIGISSSGIAYQSIDGEPVHVFILLISPQDRPADHLRALEAVVRTMKDDRFVQELRQTADKEDLWNLLERAAPRWDRT